MADLAKDLVQAAYDGMDEETKKAARFYDDPDQRDQARAATIAVLRKLADGKSGTPLAYHERKLIGGLADQIERGESRG